jgi:succinate dehydrogenase / fumarate reductase cytochrome b subunit
MIIAYYPGCEAKIVATEAYKATKMVLEKLGIELVELENAGCCGSMDLRIDDFDVTLSLNGRILALAEEVGAYKLLTSCNTCALNLNMAISIYNKDEVARAKLNHILSIYGRKYSGTMEVITLPWLLLRLVGFSSMRKATKKPLDRLKIAPFYGCHMIRPMKFYGFENSLKPSSIDVLIREFFDGHTVNYQGKSSCCGFHTLLTDEKTSTSMVSYLIKDAIKAGADCIVTPCTQCHTTLDTYQQRALKASIDSNFEIPIIHLSQLVGLAIGIPKEELCFERHMVNPLKLLEDRGL